MAARRPILSPFALWLLLLCGLAVPGMYLLVRQSGLDACPTGLNNDVAWGLYIGQFTFLAGVAASGVVFLLPFHFHGDERFRAFLLPGEYLALGAVIAACLFLLADLGQPARIWNILLHPNPGSIIFWDTLILPGYVLLLLAAARIRRHWREYGAPPPFWHKGLLTLSILWALALHTVTAFLYAGLAARGFWLSSVLAARFLASALCSGPALLLLICFAGRRVFRFSPDPEAVGLILKLIAYSMGLNLFFFSLNCFSVFYSQMPALTAPYAALTALSGIPAWCAGLGIVSFLLLAFPAGRAHPVLMPLALVLLLFSLWLDKGYLLLPGGFALTPLGQTAAYSPTLTEACISLSIYAVGAILVSLGLLNCPIPQPAAPGNPDRRNGIPERRRRCCPGRQKRAGQDGNY
ncbi:MAG: polysulfide reductase NrfD [Desulfovibrio sp.]|jgi:molybdopterin-containing oxidoreductase family membrane subunit|nr:polysulfide reductase NrfD [Desulfovibrio sp.]